MRILTVVILASGLALNACGGDSKPAEKEAAAPSTAAPGAATPGEAEAAADDALASAPPLELHEDYAHFLDPKFDDLDGMLKRRSIRVLVVQSKLFYFIDQGQQRGLTYDALQMFEEQLNKKFKTEKLRVHVVPIPVARDQLFTALAAGRGDIAAAGLTITAKREQQVDFSAPFAEGGTEIVVTGPAAPELKSLNDLSGKQVWVRKSSSYYESLEALNRTLKSAGRPPIDIRPADEHLEDEDLIEMVGTGLLPMTVADSYLANFWTQVFEKAKARSDLTVHVGSRFGWALRKNTPRLKALVDEFVAGHKVGTRSGNIVMVKYLKNVDWVKNAMDQSELAKLEPMINAFRRYGEQFDFDPLMVAAQAYQESGLDQSKRSHVGAIGVMQVMPTTAADKRVNVKGIENLDPNILAGTKYLRLLEDQYFNDAGISQIDKMLFTFAAYNAGPARIQGLRRDAPKQGLDPNKWFQNVEVMASRRIGRETVQYVSNIYKYYLAYQLVLQSGQLKKEAKQKAAT
ncbi:MAG TPA: lytic transglycosylase F [Steroidobacteraceae bacterium]|nr:lytic transglycosylase F [Steroidobacteraceae bacterium]